MGRRGSENRAMSGQVLVRLSPALAVAVSGAALSADLSAAAWLRGRAAEAVGHSEEARPTGPVDAVPEPFLAELGRLARFVSRLNGAVTQMAMALRETGHPAHGEAESVLAQLRPLRLQLTDALEEVRRDRGRHPR